MVPSTLHKFQVVAMISRVAYFRFQSRCRSSKRNEYAATPPRLTDVVTHSLSLERARLTSAAISIKQASRIGRVAKTSHMANVSCHY
jgi:hypothetical protein